MSWPLRLLRASRQSSRLSVSRNSLTANGSLPHTNIRLLATIVDRDPAATLALPPDPESDPRKNVIGVQQLSSKIHSQLFPNQPVPPPEELINLSKKHLEHHELLGKVSDKSSPISFDLPKLQGSSLDEHFYKLGMQAAEPYLSYAKKFASACIPERPKKDWEKRSGWTKYQNGMVEAVDYPDEEMLVFDCEVLYKESPFAIMACAVSPTAWYAWISPWLLDKGASERQLVPLGPADKERIITGHNIGYDRARVAEEYNFKQTKNAFLDTMSLHVAVNGMCSRQRPTWMKHAKNEEARKKMAESTDNAEFARMLENSRVTDEEAELWIGRSSINSLRDVAKFHCDLTIDKAVRDQFGELSREGVVDRLQILLDYCAADVKVTHMVYAKVLPTFLEMCPHPVSFAALRHLSSVTLPVNRSWESYIKDANDKYLELSDKVQSRLVKLARDAVEHKEEPEFYLNDPWLSQLDWTKQEQKMTKATKKQPSRPVKNQRMPGFPAWYKDLCTKGDNINLTVRTRVAPLLLKLNWKGYPLFWSDKNGWTFRVPNEKADEFENTTDVRANMDEEKNLLLKLDNKHRYYKIPHKDGPQARCSNVLAKGYMQYFEDETLTSVYDLAKEALEMNAQCSYWISARERIMSQMVIWDSDLKQGLGLPRLPDQPELGMILPQLIPMGTITRRAVEATWLTASNAKKNRVGSELKAMVTAPPGYCLVGADVDSQELWIASLVGDSQFGIHGGNAIGFMTLEGAKAAGTDLHSRTAKTLGIHRNSAKIFNYGRIYGAGLKFAIMLLRQFSPGLSDADASKIAGALYEETKGIKTTRKILSDKAFWRGGTESLVFNTLEQFADQVERPRTPVLGASITEALMSRFLTRNGFLTSRINWAIQSSGVDYLHLLIVSMDYLINQTGINARLAITVHDEIRYLVEEKDKYRAAMALQVSNLWVRAMFSQQMGIDDVPQSCAYFSAVDIDKVLRKEVDLECVTPSHPTKIPVGESLDLPQLLAKGEEARLTMLEEPNLEKFQYTPRTPVMQTISDASLEKKLIFLKAQNAATDEELKQVVREAQLLAKPPTITPRTLDSLDGVAIKRKRAMRPDREENHDVVNRVYKEPGAALYHYDGGNKYWDAEAPARAVGREMSKRAALSPSVGYNYAAKPRVAVENARKQSKTSDEIFWDMLYANANAKNYA